jgi:amino acid permease
MGFCATLFTFIKLNLVTGFLFLPAGFLNGGWLFTIIVLAIIMCLNAYSMIDICECSEKFDTYSLSKIGYAALGKCGFYFCEFSIAFVQVNKYFYIIYSTFFLILVMFSMLLYYFIY